MNYPDQQGAERLHRIERLTDRELKEIRKKCEERRKRLTMPKLRAFSITPQRSTSLSVAQRYRVSLTDAMLVPIAWNALLISATWLAS